MTAFRCFFAAVFFLLFLTGGASAREPMTDAMNGYTMAQFGDFEKTWHLVTSRFRRDTGEMRLTYANDIAWKALQGGSSDYPDGAVFAKIGMKTEDDPDFTSSAVPSGARRYQFMVRDLKKHADTMGWGYAIFTPDGKATFSPEDQEIESHACSACHEMVPHRGYVFSQPMTLAAGRQAQPPKTPAPQGLMFFETVDVAALPEPVRREVPAGLKQLRRLHGPFEKKVFTGTMGEIRPALIKEALRTRSPAALVDGGTALFALAYVSPDKPDCSADGKKGISVISIFTVGHVANKTPAIEKNTHCEPLAP